MKKYLFNLAVVLVALFAAVSSASAYEWVGNDVNTTDEFYLYNAGFKCFIANDGSMQANPEKASKWKFDGTETSQIVSDGKAFFHNSVQIGIDNVGSWGMFRSGEFILEKHSMVAGAYAFKGSDRYFNIENKSGNITRAENLGESNAWLLITQAQVDEYAKELEAWECARFEAGNFYLYNIYTGKYLKNGNELSDVDNATLYSVASDGSIKYGDKYVGQSKGVQSNSQVKWSFDLVNNMYRISSKNGDSSTRYLQADSETNVSFPKSGSVQDIRRTYWILVPEAEREMKESLTLTIPASGYTTYSNKNTGVKFVDENFKAYAATGATDTSLSFTSIEEMSVSEGALIKGTPGTWRLAPAKDAEENAANLLKPGDGQTHPGAYVLASATGWPLGFYVLNEKVTIPVGKAYLQVSSGVKGFALDDANIEEATAISSVSAEGTTDIYSVQGIKVNAGYKGMVIKGGKKFLQK